MNHISFKKYFTYLIGTEPIISRDHRESPKCNRGYQVASITSNYTVKRARPLRRRRTRVARPPCEPCRLRKPWVRARFRRFGLYVNDMSRVYNTFFKETRRIQEGHLLQKSFSTTYQHGYKRFTSVVIVSTSI